MKLAKYLAFFIVLVFASSLTPSPSSAQSDPAIKVTVEVASGGNPYTVWVENHTGEEILYQSMGAEQSVPPGGTGGFRYTNPSSICNGNVVDIAGTIVWSGGNWRFPTFKCSLGTTTVIFDNTGLAASPPAQPSSNQTVSAAVPQGEGACVASNGTNVNIRSGAGTEYGKVGTLSPGQTLVITNTQGDWYQVESGWVSATVTHRTACAGDTISATISQPPAQNSASCWKETGTNLRIGGAIPRERGFDAQTAGKIVTFAQQIMGGTLPETYLVYVWTDAEARVIDPMWTSYAGEFLTASLSADGCSLVAGNDVYAIIVMRGLADAAYTFDTVAHEVSHGLGSDDADWSADSSLGVNISHAYFWGNVTNNAYSGTCAHSADPNFCSAFRSYVFG